MLSFKKNNKVIVKEKNLLYYPFSNSHNINILNNMFKKFSKLNSENKGVQVNNLGKSFTKNSLHNFSYLANEKINTKLPKINSYSIEENYLNIAKINDINLNNHKNINDNNIINNNIKPKTNKLLIIGKYSKFDLKLLYKQYKLSSLKKKDIKNKSKNLSDIIDLKINSPFQNQYLRLKLGILHKKKIKPIKLLKKSNSIIESLEISNLSYSKRSNINKTLPSENKKIIDNINKKIFNV